MAVWPVSASTGHTARDRHRPHRPVAECFRGGQWPLAFLATSSNWSR